MFFFVLGVVPSVFSVSGLSILDYLFGFLKRFLRAERKFNAFGGLC
jgi:hypothetical protein